MHRILFVAPLLLLTACPSKQDIASASAIPAYQAAAQAILAQNVKQPFTEPQKLAVKQADQKLFDVVVSINADQVRKAGDLHRLVQSM